VFAVLAAPETLKRAGNPAPAPSVPPA